MELSWKDTVVDALEQLGGHAYLSDIYKTVIERSKRKFGNNVEASIRDALQRSSSDSEKYNGNEDVFYCVDGKLKGHWGLRNYNPADKTIDYTTSDESFTEGKEKLRLHISKERNYTFIKKAKKDYNKCICQICGFDFFKNYGDIGKDFIEAHHIVPISELKNETSLKFSDLIFVCSNCHSMLHKIRPWETSIYILKKRFNN